MQQVVVNTDGQDVLDTLGITPERKGEICDIFNAEMDKAEDDPDRVMKQALPNTLNQLESENERIFLSMNFGAWMWQSQMNPLQGLLTRLQALN